MDRAGGDIIEISSCDSGASIESEEEMDYATVFLCEDRFTGEQ
jgi:hypothetical protein